MLSSLAFEVEGSPELLKRLREMGRRIDAATVSADSTEPQRAHEGA